MSNARRTLLVIAALLTLTALIALRPQGEPGVRARDFEAYYSAGATWSNGGNAYTTDVWAAESRIPGVEPGRHELLPYIGLPSFIPVFSLFARLPYGVAARLWEALLAVAFIVLAFALRSLLRQTNWSFASAIVLLASFVPLTSDFGLGQAALMAYAASVVALATIETQPMFAWLGIVVAALQPNVALQLLAGFTRRRGAYALIAAGIALYLAGAAVGGPAWLAVYLRELQAHGGAERFAAIQMTPAAVAYGFGVAPGVASAIGMAIAVACAALALLTILRRPRPLAHQAAIACAAVPFVAGFFHEHDGVVLLLPIVLLLTAARGPLAVVALVGTMLASVNWLDFAQQPNALAQDLLLALAACAAALSFRPSRSAFIAAAIFAAFLVAGAWTGYTHPLPIWPNDMHGIPALTQSAASLWNEEQLRTGLLSPDIATALLRSFTLLGSALIFYAMLNVDVHHVVERID